MRKKSAIKDNDNKGKIKYWRWNTKTSQGLKIMMKNEDRATCIVANLNTITHVNSAVQPIQFPCIALNFIKITRSHII